MAIPERNGPNSERQGPHTNKIIQVGQRNEDAAAINDAFPVPKIVNCEIIGRHPNKSAFVRPKSILLPFRIIVSFCPTVIQLWPLV